MDNVDRYFSTSAVASKLRIITSQKLFLYLRHLGWIIKTDGGYQLTALGEQKRGKYQTGINDSSWIIWPPEIIDYPELKEIPKEFLKVSGDQPSPIKSNKNTYVNNPLITPKLAQLAKIHDSSLSTKKDYEDRRAGIINKIQAELDTLEAEYAPLFEALGLRETELTTEIKKDVTQFGTSVAGAGIKAVYMKGRVTWNTVGLDQYSQTHPDVLQFRKQSQASVRISFSKTETISRGNHPVPTESK